MRLTDLAARPVYNVVRHGVHSGDLTNSRYTAAQTSASVRRAIVRYKCDIDVTSYGAFTLTRHAPPNIVISIRHEPWRETMPARVTARQAADLAIIAARVGRSVPAALNPRKDGALQVYAGWNAVPPAATERLMRRGWIVTRGNEGDTVTVSVAGYLAMAAHTCDTTRATHDERVAAYADAIRTFAAA